MKTIASEQRRHVELNGPDPLQQTKVKFNISSDSIDSPRNNNVPALPLTWDSLESDTESLAQEKEYQRELQMRIDLLSADNPKQHDAKTDSEELEHIDVCDSLDLKPREVTGPHEPLRQAPPEDEYTDLRYDPNWRKNLEGAHFLNQLSARLSLNSFEESEDSLEPLENLPLSSRQEYVVVSNPPTVQMDNVLSPPPSSPFHLHPQQEDILDPPESKSSCMSSEGTPWDNEEHLNVRSVPHWKRSSQHPSNPRLVRAREDIVERNKATLGIHTHKQGSYLKVHQQKDKTEETKQPKQTSYKTISTHSPESQDNVWDLELMWLQKTQKLKSHKEKKERKRRERTSNHPDQLKPPVPESKPKAHLTGRSVISSNLVPQDSEEAWTQDPLQHHSGLPSHTHAPPTVNLNINLHTPANLAQPLNLSQKETIFTLVSQALQWDRPDLFNQLFLQQGYPFSPYAPPNSGGQMGLAPKAVVSSPAPKSGVVQAVDISVPQRHAGKPTSNTFEKSSFRNHSRIPTLKLPTSSQLETSHYPSELLPSDEQSVGPCAPPTQISGPYTVLPPIVRAIGSDAELSDSSEQHLNPIHKSSSEGYLSQMEKQRQLKAQSNYKAYSLKDYKNMKQEVRLGGLGPTNTIPEAVAEKIRRQKLYSNVIREQNKKISRIPSLSAKDPVGSDNKNIIPRRKALEYAKTIAKPKPPPKPKDRSREQNVSTRFEMDPFHLATLEMLRRHEEEKRAVARFRTIHAI
ncbi:jhy protein homolog isoform X1 [Carassius auratus]|uniref:Jhy protein homolog isoform X1 n=1 Tax=Carassius auratus TaxID=7957 RepID=A0A6P6Q8T2_CARAU|nr:jhy protein homolog isoform X1 [Carassius auratus]XP_026129577.1 jhy protein homolog isoform X1 [Carassius auratus]